MPELVLTFESSALMECCKASQFSNDAGARIWQAADVGYMALQYGAWLTWACLTLQLSSHYFCKSLPILFLYFCKSHASLHFLSFFVKTFLVYWYIIIYATVQFASIHIWS